MPSRCGSPEISDAVHALIVEDDILVAAFLEGVLLDRGIGADRALMEDCDDCLLQRRYDVAVVGIDRQSDVARSSIHLLQLREIPVVLFTVLGDPHRLASTFPHLPIYLYDARFSDSIAAKVACAAAAGTRAASDVVPAGALRSIWP